MEYVDLSIGIPAIVGEPSIVNGSGSTFTPNTKPIYKTSTFATENITNFFVELEFMHDLTNFFHKILNPHGKSDASSPPADVKRFSTFGRNPSGIAKIVLSC